MSDDTSSEELYSVKSSQIVYKRSHSRPSIATREPVHASPVPKLVVTSSDDRRESTTYLPVGKWAIDYNNKNYIRSKCNKNIGLHRRVQGRPLNYHIEYDNNYHVRSKVNAPKGLHRKQFEVKRKYAPDRDDLADATGWEFDWGPEIDQIEQDVPFIPEGRIVSRGGYRWYGVRRNDSDCDVRQEEQRENLLNEALLAELKTGHEFLQADVPHLTEGEKRKYNRGAYRCYEAQRNVYDIKPELPTAGRDPEWRRKYHSNGIHYLDLDRKSYVEDIGISDDRIIKGKPFKRTVLNKVYELRKEKDTRDSRPRRRATRLSLVPGEGEKTLYEGVPDRFPLGVRESPSIRSVFKKKSERYRSQEGSEYEEYERHDTEERRGELTSRQEERLRKMAAEKRRSPSRSIPERDEGRLGVPSTGYTYRAETEIELEPRRPDSRIIESPSDVRKGLQSLNEDAQTNRQSSHFVNRSRNEREESRAARDHEESVSRRHHPSSKMREEDVRDEYETWRDNVENTRRERERQANRPVSKRERKRSESFKDYNRGVRHKSEAKMSKQRPNGFHPDAEKSQGGKRKIKPSPQIHGPKLSIYDQEERRSRYKEHDDHLSLKNRVGSNWKARDNESREIKSRKGEFQKKVPPHVEKRMREIEDKMERKIERINNKHKYIRPESSGSSEDIIDFDKHKSHPKDRGHSHNSEYEKYVTKNGSEYWVKNEEKFSELRHRNMR